MKPETKTNRVQLSCAVDKAIKNQLVERAELNHLSISRTTEILLREALKQKELVILRG